MRSSSNCKRFKFSIIVPGSVSIWGGDALLSATDSIYNTWSLVWMQKNFSSNLRVHFKVNFIAGLRTPNSKSCKAFSKFISKTILERVANGSLTVLGKAGEVSPPHLVMPITMEPSKPRMCQDEIFLNSARIKDLPFSLDLNLLRTNLPQQ